MPPGPSFRCPDTRQQLRCLRRSPIPRRPWLRAFHASRPNGLLVELVEPLSQGLHWGFQELHTQTDLPWALTIPLGAAIIRTSWLPVQYLSSRIRKRREVATNLVLSWREAYRDIARIKFPDTPARQGVKQAQSWVAKQLKTRRKEIRKRSPYLGAWADFSLGVSFIPVWILATDCIRGMTGTAETLTSALFKGTEQGSAMNLDKLEPGFQTESLYWIPSLVDGDPLWILPIGYGVIATLNAWLRVKESLGKGAGSFSQLSRASKIWRIISYALLGMPSVFTMVIIRSDLATAIVLYLIGSSVTQVVQHPLVSKITGTSTKLPKLKGRLPEAKKNTNGKLPAQGNKLGP